MNSSMEFIEGIDADQKTVAIIPEASPIWLMVGMVIEIHHRDYRIGRINPIVTRRNNNYDCEITYQIHVEKMKD